MNRHYHLFAFDDDSGAGFYTYRGSYDDWKAVEDAVKVVTWNDPKDGELLELNGMTHEFYEVLTEESGELKLVASRMQGRNHEFTDGMPSGATYVTDWIFEPGYEDLALGSKPEKDSR